MTIPTDSVAPVSIESADPWYTLGVGALVRGFKRVTTWVTGLSPAGSTVYDTGWSALPVSGATAVYCQIRRSGKRVRFRLEVHSVTPGTLLTIPAGYRPTARVSYFATRWATSMSTANILGVAIATDGTVSVSLAAGATVTSSPGYTLDVGWELD